MSHEPTMLGRVEEYLAMRRRLGFSLRSLGEEIRLFGRFADAVGHQGPPTTELIVRWAQLAPQAQPAYWAWRFQAVRRFAQHVALDDPRTEVPPRDLLGHTFRRAQPHIYAPSEIAALVGAARAFDRCMPSCTYAVYFGLLAATGMRAGEGLGLTREDVDLQNGVIRIVKAKAAKSRVVPLHESTTAALRRYAAVRDRICVRPKSDAFFLSFRWTKLQYQNVTTTFRRLRRQLGWTASNGSLPRVHDLRHTFAVRTLCRWYEEGENVDERITSLAAYLGHVNVSSTYWYLTAVPELMAFGARRFEASSLRQPLT